MPHGHKKLDINMRMIIQVCLQKGYSERDIAKRLNVAPSTISREIKRNLYVKRGTRDCTLKPIPKICNQCCKKAYCNCHKRYYDFQLANKIAMELRRNSHNSLKVNESDFKYLDDVLFDGIAENGQSLHHAYASDERLQTICSEDTLRRYIYKNILRTKKHHLRRYKRFKHSYKKTNEEINARNLAMYVDRTYSMYLEYVKSHPEANIVQFDSIIGKRSDAFSILTITSIKHSFQIGILYHKGRHYEVNHIIKDLFKKLGKELTRKFFGVCLCDNGVEFSTFYDIENDDETKENLTHVFFTKPYRATDKPHCERNHELVRYLIPKCTTFDKYTQSQIDECFSNINSYTRKSKGDLTPYKLVRKEFGTRLLDVVNQVEIPLKKVKLR